MCTPGVSTGWLNVITVFRFQSSALALGENTVAMSAAQTTIGAAFKKFIFCPSASEFVSGTHAAGRSTRTSVGGCPPFRRQLQGRRSKKGKVSFQRIDHIESDDQMRSKIAAVA